MSAKKEAVLRYITKEAGRGASLIELQAACSSAPRRTIQRWISQFIREGKLRAEGNGRARRYYRVKEALSTTKDDPQTTVAMPLSADSRDVLCYVSQPIAQRHPVGYQQDFLMDYQPNKTWYLSKPLRQQLERMGRTPQVGSAVGTYGCSILSRLLIDLSWASSSLEGNTYSLLETKKLIEEGNAASGRSALEAQMILNHKTAIEMLVEHVESVQFDRYTILNLHGALSENLMINPVDEGRVRSHEVEIGKSVYRPLTVSAKVDEMFNQVLNIANEICDPFEQAFFMLVHLPYLQPFADVNKRTSRLAANIPLLRANLCPLTFLGVSQDIYTKAILGVYEMTRVELLRDLFVWAYERSTREYLSIKQEVDEPNALRLANRKVIKDTVKQVILEFEREPLDIIRQQVPQYVAEENQEDVIALVIEELRRLHEGNLARYGLNILAFNRWKNVGGHPAAVITRSP